MARTWPHFWQQAKSFGGFPQSRKVGSNFGEYNPLLLWAVPPLYSLPRHRFITKCTQMVFARLKLSATVFPGLDPGHDGVLCLDILDVCLIWPGSLPRGS